MTDTIAEIPRHPARFSTAVLEAIAPYLGAEAEQREARLRVLDPFAGVGTLFDALNPNVVYEARGVELEPEWAAARPETVVGDSRDLASLFAPATFDAIVTSPCYGNRMADCHNAQDPCKTCEGTGVAHRGSMLCLTCRGSGRSRRNTYRAALGRMPSEGSAAVLQWGPRYRRLHAAVWRSCLDVLAPGGLVIVNVKNHIRDGVEQRVAEWHLTEWLALGAGLIEVRRVATPGLRYGENFDARVDADMVLVLRASAELSGRQLPLGGAR